MYFKLVLCLCSVIYFIGVRSQRIWAPGGHNSGFSNSWAPKGFSNVGNWGSNRPNQPVFGGNQFISPFGINADRRPVEQQSFYESLGSDNAGWNSDEPGKSNGGFSGGAFNLKKQDESKLSSIINLPDTNKNTFSPSENDNLSSFSQFLGSNNQNSKTNEWNLSSNSADTPQSNSFSSVTNDNNYSSFISSRPSGTSSQNSNLDNNKSNNINKKPNSSSLSSGPNEEFSNWGSNKPSSANTQNSNNFNNNNEPIGIDVPVNTDYEGNSVYSWDSKNKEKNQPSKSKLKTTKSKPTKSGSQHSGSNWNPTGNEKAQVESNNQNDRKATTDTSILDELDKNDWYFGKESNYPKPPFKSALNIDVSKLWNFDKNRKSSQNFKESMDKNRNNNRRRNRQAGGVGGIQCECVNVKFCDEENMIITQEDIKYGWRPLEEFRCERLTEVCCTDPKPRLFSTADIGEENIKPLNCGQRRSNNGPFKAFRRVGNIAEPGEFPWNLKFLHRSLEINCGASLIHPQLALTAAHCVTNIQPNEVNLKAGIWNFDKESSQIQNVSRIILHPAYSSRNPRNDIALLVLEKGFELNDNVNTICLPFSNDRWDSDRCLVAGWGLEGVNGETLRVLKKETVDFIPQPQCQNILLVTDLWRNYILHDSFVCARNKGESNACLESEGAPVLCPNQKRPNTYLQIGIVSEGMNCDGFGRPGIFTNVLQFLDWINQNRFDLGFNYDIDNRSL